MFKNKLFSKSSFLISVAILITALFARPLFANQHYQQKQTIAEKNFKIGDIVNGWKVVESIKNENIDGTYFDSYTLFERELTTKVLYYNSDGESGQNLMFKFPAKAQKLLPSKNLIFASILDKDFPYEIPGGSYGVMDVIINKIQIIEAATDATSDMVFVSKILAANEKGRILWNYDNEDSDHYKSEVKKEENFFKSNNFKIIPTLPFSTKSMVKLQQIDELEKIIEKYGIYAKDAFGDNLLHMAINLESQKVWKFLLDQKEIDLDAKNNLGQTPLHLVTTKGNIELIKLLIKKGANPKSLDNHNNGLVHIATQKNNIDMLSFLINELKIDASKPNLFEITPVDYSQNYESLKLIVSGGGKIADSKYKGLKLAEQAFREEGKDFFNFILNHGFDLNFYGTKILSNISDNNLDFVKFLLSKNLNINSQNDWGGTILMDKSWMKNSNEVIKFLLENGANPNLQDKNGDTALHKAASFLNAQNIQTLLDYGADFTIKNNKGLTAIEAVKNQNHYVKPTKENLEKEQLVLDLLENAKTKK